MELLESSKSSMGTFSKHHLRPETRLGGKGFRDLQPPLPTGHTPTSAPMFSECPTAQHHLWVTSHTSQSLSRPWSGGSRGRLAKGLGRQQGALEKTEVLWTGLQGRRGCEHWLKWESLSPPPPSPPQTSWSSTWEKHPAGRKPMGMM